jgi:hypothetical protein
MIIGLQADAQIQRQHCKSDERQSDKSAFKKKKKKKEKVDERTGSNHTDVGTRAAN